MYMGQLFEGDEAVEYFKTGIELMKKEKERQEKEVSEVGLSDILLPTKNHCGTRVSWPSV